MLPQQTSAFQSPGPAVAGATAVAGLASLIQDPAPAPPPATSLSPSHRPGEGSEDLGRPASAFEVPENRFSNGFVEQGSHIPGNWSGEGAGPWRVDSESRHSEGQYQNTPSGWEQFRSF